MNSRAILGSIVAVLVLGLAAWWTVENTSDEPADEVAGVTSFDECVAAGNAVMESYPRQCRADGQTFVEEIDEPEDGLYEYSSLKGVLVKLNVSPNQQLASPLTVRGEVPGNWSFEATFPLVLTDWDGLIIADTFATLQGDWMTEDYVEFTAEVEFETPSVRENGSLVLQKSNPSGLAENDDAVEIPVTFDSSE